MPSVATVTLNPALDRTVSLDRLQPGGLNRALSVRLDAGGKGINLARVLRRLGIDAVSLGFLAGDTGRLVAELLGREGMASDFVWVPGETRTNLKLVDGRGRVTEVNEPGPLVTEVELQALEARVLALDPAVQVLALAGSAPPGVEPELYGRLLRLARERGLRTVLDAEGDALEAGLEARPYLVKPNADEAARLFGERPGTLAEAAEMAATLVERGVELALVSLGAAGCAFATRGESGWGRPPEVPVRGTVGAGDSLLAGVVAGVLGGREASEAVRMGVAVAASAVAQEGPGRPDPEQVRALLAAVVMEVRPAAPQVTGPKVTTPQTADPGNGGRT